MSETGATVINLPQGNGTIPCLGYENNTVIEIEGKERSQKLTWFYRHLPEIFADHETVAFSTFKQIFTKDFAKQLFRLFDLDGNGQVDVEEIIGGLKKITSDHPVEMHEMTQGLFAHADPAHNDVKFQDFQRMLGDTRFQRSFYESLKRSQSSAGVVVSDFYSALEDLAKMDTDEGYFNWLKVMLQEIAPKQSEISIADFQKIFRTRDELLSKRLFHALSENETEIAVTDFVERIHNVFLGSKDDKLKFLFKVYDLDGDGTISKDNLEEIMKSCLNEFSVKLTKHALETLTEAMWETMLEASVKSNGSTRQRALPDNLITFEEFKSGMMAFPELLDNLSISYFVKPNDAPKPSFQKPASRKERMFFYLHNNVSLVVTTIVLVILNIVLGLEAGSRYWNIVNGYVLVARICGQLLNFNSALILIFVCRHFLTMLRSTPLFRILPIDSVLMFHKKIGLFIGILSIIHGIMHVVNITIVAKATNFTVFDLMLTTKPGIGWVAGCSMITGWVLILILIIMTIMAMPFVRRKGYFEAFYWTHQLFIAYEIILILHGPRFWRWILVPGIIYLVDRILRLSIFTRLMNGKFVVSSATTCPSKVVHLKISREYKWKFNSGDYVFINIPEIAQFEWHPFTISSPPELEGSFTVHIRAVGNWTNKLYDTVAQRSITRTKSIDNDEQFENAECESETRVIKMLKEKTFHKSGNKLRNRKGVQLKKKSKESPSFAHHQSDGILKEIYVSGPFGSASDKIFYTRNAVLISTGIGVTPYASILQSVFYQLLAQLHYCQNCGSVSLQDQAKAMHIRRLDFYWINRTHNAFEWFTEILRDLEDARIVIGDKIDHFQFGLHLYLTGAPPSSDVKAIALKVALEMAYKKLNRDLLSGLQSRIETGRPNWRKEFEMLKAKSGDEKVSIFYCGMPAVKKELKKLCNMYDFEFHEEVF